jgi:hypothetical protein
MHGAGPLFPAQTLHAFCDGTGRHQHHFAALCAQYCDLFGPITESAHIQAGALIGNEAAADFDDDASGLGQNGFHACGS